MGSTHNPPKKTNKKTLAVRKNMKTHGKKVDNLGKILRILGK
jgi:hypothetical protein